jgi:hypothetical protein
MLRTAVSVSLVSALATGALAGDPSALSSASVTTAAPTW